jgi:hypothetical protein
VPPCSVSSSSIKSVKIPDYSRNVWLQKKEVIHAVRNTEVIVDVTIKFNFYPELINSNAVLLPFNTYKLLWPALIGYKHLITTFQQNSSREAL